LRAYDQLSNQVVDRGMSQLRRDEQSKLVRFFEALNNALNAPEGAERKRDRPFRVSMRRLTHALGLLRSEYLDSGLSMAEWQVLSELVYHPVVTSSGQLQALFGFPQSVLSQLLSALQKRKLLRRSPHPKDRRAQVLRATASGVARIADIEASAARQLDDALSFVDATQTSEGLEALRRYVGPTPGGIAIDGGLELKPIATEEQYRAARYALVQSMAADPTAANLSSGTILHASSLNYAVVESSELLGVAEISTDGTTIHHQPPQVSRAALLDAVRLHQNTLVPAT
jgi:DNA-binding MarR family transcriptional regulator